MKKLTLTVAAVLLAGGFMTSSCIGSFALFNKYEKWQCNMTSTKIVNGIVGLILQPIVAPICITVDAIVLNTIEFWSGSNPLVALQEVVGSDGRTYLVKTTRNGYEITSPDGEVTLFVHNKKNDSWSVQQGNISKELFRFNEDGTIQATLQSGKTITVGNNEAGLQQVHEAIYTDMGYALR